MDSYDKMKFFKRNKNCRVSWADYRSTCLGGKKASLRNKASEDYTIIIYHIWRYLTNILNIVHKRSVVDGDTREEGKACNQLSIWIYIPCSHNYDAPQMLWLDWSMVIYKDRSS